MSQLKTSKPFSFTLKTLSLAIGLSGVSTDLLAAADNTTATATTTENVLTETLVTAQKREQRLLDIPIAISVIDSKSLQARQSNNLTDIAQQVPGLQISSPNGSILPIFSIRGVSMSDYNLNQASPVGIYLDEVYLSANYTHGLSLFDLERIEVLRGPQGTLYGKNTTGGAINIISRKPDFDSDGYLRITAGNYNKRAVQAAYEHPLIDNVLAARFAVNYETADGYAKNHFPGGDDLSGTDRLATRLTLLLQPSDSLDATLSINTGHSDPTTQGVVFEPTGANGLDLVSTVLASQGEAFYQRPASYGYHDVDANKVDHSRVLTQGANLTINKSFDNIRLTSVSSYYNGKYDQLADSDGTPIQILEIDGHAEVDQWSQDLRISSIQAEPWAYTLGLYAAGEKHNVYNAYDFYHSWQVLDPAIAAGFTLDQRYQQERESRAIYGQLDYKLSSTLTLTSGLRYTEDENRQFNASSYQTDYDGNPLAGLIPFSFPYDPTAVQPGDDFTDREWTGTLKLSYSPETLDNMLLYSSYSRGYRSGAFNGAATLSPTELAPVDPEFVNAYEMGAKGQLINGQLQYSAALFHYSYQNQQFTKIVGIQQLLDSADRARSRGFELELDLQANAALSIHMSLALLDTEYTEGLELTTGGNSYDLTGNTLISAPEVSADIAADYRFAWRGGNVTTHLDLGYVGEQWFTAFNDKAGFDNIGQSGHTLFNGRIDYAWDNEQYTLSLWGRNLTDKEYQVYAINLSDGFGYHYTIKGVPRTFGVDFQLAF